MKRGITAREIVVIVVILVVIAFITIQSLLERKKPPAMSLAIANVRVIKSAEELYKKEYGTYATLAQLCNAGYIDSTFGSAQVSPKQGYYYTLTADKNNWCCVARPAVWGFPSSDYYKWYMKRNYLVSTDSVIYYNEEENSSEFTKKLGE